MLILQGFTRYIFLIGLMTHLLFGCSTPSTSKIKPLQPTKQSSVILKKMWQTSLPFLIKGSPIVINNGNHLLVAHANGIHQYKTTTGTVIWRSNIGAIQSSLAISSDERTLIAWLKNSEVVALNTANGKVLWRTALPIESNVAPVLLENSVIILTTDGRVIALDAVTGDRIWSVFRVVPALSLQLSGAMLAINASTVIIGFPGGKVMALKAATGEVIWEEKVSIAQGVNEIERIADILPNWLLVPNLGACATVYLQSIVCINDQGKTTYQQATNSTMGLIASSQYWFSLSDSNRLKAWLFAPKTSINPPNNPSNFSNKVANTPSIWSLESSKEPAMGYPLLSIAANDRYLLTVDSKGTVYVLSPSTGARLAQAKVGFFPKKNILLSPIMVDAVSSVVITDDQHLSVWSLQ
jgi:outer membrane protein assembly factor BamB